MNNSLSISVKKRFLDYLSAGSEEIIRMNRGNLEECLRQEIDIEKSTPLVKRYRKHNSKDSIVIAPEFFFALSLIDEMPANIDFRFTPEFYLDGIVFKYAHPTSHVIHSKKILYRERIATLLRLQLSPNIEMESNKSAVYLERLTTKLSKFNSAFKQGMKYFRKHVYDTCESNSAHALFFLDWSISCINNTRKRNRFSRTEWLKHSNKFSFCREYIKLVDEFPDKDLKGVYRIIIKRMFPKLSTEQIHGILIHTSGVTSKSFDAIKSILYPVYELKKAYSREDTLVYDDYKTYKEKLKLKRNETINTISRTTFQHYTENCTNFFNLLLIVENEYSGLYKTKPQLNISCLYDICKMALELESMGNWILEQQTIDSEYTNIPLIDAYNSYQAMLRSCPLLLDSIKKNRIEITWDKFSEDLFSRWLKKIYSVKQYETVFEYGKFVNKIDGDKNYILTPEWIDLMEDNKLLLEFCRNPHAWDCPPNTASLYEVSTGKNISRVHNIGTIHVLNFLFQEHTPSGFFNNVEHILFHQNMLLVQKDNDLVSISPSETYKLLALKNMDEEIIQEDEGNTQLDRFRKVLNEIFIEKTTLHFNNQSGSNFIDTLSSATGIQFVSILNRTNQGETEQHHLSWGSMSSFDQDNISSFFTEFQFIFPNSISEIHLDIVAPKSRKHIPLDEKELLFFIETLRAEQMNHIVTEKYSITLEDLILLGRSKRFYTVVLIERACAVIYNKRIMGQEDILTEFKSVIGQQNINIIHKQFIIRRKQITENQLLRHIFIQYGIKFIQEKRESLSAPLIEFLSKIFNKTLQFKISENAGS